MFEFPLMSSALLVLIYSCFGVTQTMFARVRMKVKPEMACVLVCVFIDCGKPNFSPDVSDLFSFSTRGAHG